jgi:hypothetical protein
VIVHVCGHGLFRSTDRGETFDRLVIEGLAPAPAASHMTGFPDRASLIKFSPRYHTDGTLLLSSMQDLFISRDCWRSWKRVGRPVRFESLRPEISQHGTWKTLRDGRFSSGSAICSSAPGETATMEFLGREVSWIGKHGPEQGKARVLVDGVAVATVDQYAAAPTYSTVSYATSSLPYGLHTISIEVAPAKNPRSVGREIVIDAFDVRR